MKKYIYIIFAALSFLCLSSCTDVLEDGNAGVCQPSGIEDGDFVISMNVPSIQVSSRVSNIAGDPENEKDSWTTWEKFCDGALLYRVTIFVVDSKGTLVGYRDFYKGSDDIKAETEPEGGNGFYADGAVNTNLANGIAVKATFKANNPLHGDIEKLQAETYKIYAVANYAPISDTNAEYAGLGVETADVDATSETPKNGESSGSENNFTNIVNGIIDSFDPDKGVAGFEDNTDFFNYKLNAGTDRVCKMQPQPLVMIRSVDLSKTNQLSGELARTFARIRLVVKNVNTGSDQIAISNLNFASMYASQKAYLFNDVGAPVYDDGTTDNLHDHFDLYGDETENEDGTTTFVPLTAGAINVESSDVLHDLNNASFRLTSGAERLLFDCYLLEGKISGNAFSFTATYWTGGTSEGATENIEIHDWDDFLYDTNTTGSPHRQVFIRRNTNDSKKLLQANSSTNNVTISTRQQYAVDNAEKPLDPIFVWEVQPTQATPSISGELGSTYGELFSIGTSMYLQPYDGENTTPQLAYTPSGGKIFFKINFSGQDEYGSIYSVYGSNYWYINSEGLWRNSNVSATNQTTTPTISDDSYQRLTFETIPGVAGTAQPKKVSKQIVMNDTIVNNQIVRNDFFWGTIPLYIKDGIVLSEDELTWYLNDNSSQTITYSFNGSVSITSVASDAASSNFTWSYSDGNLVFTPKDTTSECTETITITLSNGTTEEIVLEVMEEPTNIVYSQTFNFQYQTTSGGGNRPGSGQTTTNTITEEGVTISSDVNCTLIYADGKYTLTINDTSEVSSETITFSYVVTSGDSSTTYTRSITVETLIGYEDGQTITLQTNQNQGNRP